MDTNGGTVTLPPGHCYRCNSTGAHTQHGGLWDNICQGHQHPQTLEHLATVMWSAGLQEVGMHSTDPNTSREARNALREALVAYLSR